MRKLTNLTLPKIPRGGPFKLEKCFPWLTSKNKEPTKNWFWTLGENLWTNQLIFLNEGRSRFPFRVYPETRLSDLRAVLIDQVMQSGGVLPHKFVFLKSVGRALTLVKDQQEQQLKVKNFLPPFVSSYMPSSVYFIFIKNVQPFETNYFENWIFPQLAAIRAFETRNLMLGYGKIHLPP